MFRWGGRVSAVVLGVVLLTPVGLFSSPRTFNDIVPRFGRAYAPIPTAGMSFAFGRSPGAKTDSRLVAHRSSIAPAARRTAVIVGINHARGTSPLPGSVTDALNLKRALLQFGFLPRNVTVLLESAATRPAILSALSELAVRTPRSGVAVVALATHTRRSGHMNSLATAEGARISSTELARVIRRVQAPTWVALPTCYAGGYALPGIVGPNRIATFASSADQPTYQAGDSGSFLFIYMVRKAMLEGRSPASVESAFAYASSELGDHYPEYAPAISDGVAGDLVLGSPVSRRREAREPAGRIGRAPGRRDYAAQDPARSPDRGRDQEQSAGQDRGNGIVSVCGRFRVNC